MKKRVCARKRGRGRERGGGGEKEREPTNYHNPLRRLKYFKSYQDQVDREIKTEQRLNQSPLYCPSGLTA